VKLGICNEIFQEWNEWQRICDYVADVGYNGIEIAPFTFANDVNEISAESRADIRRIAEEVGLEIIGLHWLLVGPEGVHLTTADRATRERTAHYLVDLTNCCADVGGTRMIFGSPKQRNLEAGVTYRQAFDHAREVFEKALPALEDRGVTLCMEQLAPAETDFCSTVAQTVELIDAVSHPNFQLILDTKAMAQEPLSRADTIRQYAKYLRHYHANDENLKGPGFGKVDFAPIIAALKEIHFQDYISIEVFDFDIGPTGIAGRSYEYLRQFLD
jgi:sugar phosphate isomerase/epimerase